jgi:hypothetical protein
MSKFLSATLFILLTLGTLPAESAPITVSCPFTPLVSTDREFTLTTDPAGATCLNSGSGSDQLNANSFDLMVQAGWTVIDKDENPDAVFPQESWFSVTGLGSSSGAFTVDPIAWSTFNQLAIGLKVGGGQVTPVWAVFQLPLLETAGDWSNTPVEGGGLSHAILYGRGTTTITAVPEPATVFLLGAGLAAGVRRRRRASAARC